MANDNAVCPFCGNLALCGILIGSSMGDCGVHVVPWSDGDVRPGRGQGNRVMGALRNALAGSAAHHGTIIQRSSCEGSKVMSQSLDLQELRRIHRGAHDL